MGSPPPSRHKPQIPWSINNIPSPQSESPPQSECTGGKLQLKREFQTQSPTGSTTVKHTP
jgi:hypothetical protein